MPDAIKKEILGTIGPKAIDSPTAYPEARRETWIRRERSNIKRSNIKRPNIKRSNIKRPKIKRPNIKRPKIKRPDIKRAASAWACPPQQNRLPLRS